jgi:hypothetical protein
MCFHLLYSFHSPKYALAKKSPKQKGESPYKARGCKDDYSSFPARHLLGYRMHQSCPIAKLYAINAKGFEVGFCGGTNHSYDQYEFLWFYATLISDTNIQVILVS